MAAYTVTDIDLAINALDEAISELIKRKNALEALRPRPQVRRAKVVLEKPPCMRRKTA